MIHHVAEQHAPGYHSDDSTDGDAGAQPNRLWLRLRAPFAAYRPMQAGSLRATLPVMPYSAAWGLALNLAGIDIRSDSATAPHAPPLRLCLGLTATTPPNTLPTISSLYQHLHGYPIGRSSQRFQRGAHGTKYHIAPVRRELLTNLDLIFGIEAPATHLPILTRIRAALTGTADWPRSGLPFAGDNNLLFDHIDPLSTPPPAHWYAPPAPDHDHPPITRLHVHIDRHDSSRTTTREFTPNATATTTAPADAWTWTPHPPSP